jgi:tetratricopeptide (TPR) repeat protein
MPINADLYKTVVRLTNTSKLGNRVSLGSGVVFSSTGLIITNNHVIEDPDFGTAFGQIMVESLHSADQPVSNAVPAELVIRNETYDLAVIRITGPVPAHHIDIQKTSPIDASIMERRIRVLGYPPRGGGCITVTRGIVSGFDDSRNLKTDAEINPGNSGGAALDDLDIFLGIPSFIIADVLGKLGFIISVDRIKEWFGTALKDGVPTTTEQLAAAFVGSNLNFGSDNLDQSNNYPRILSKFALAESLLSQEKYEAVIPHIAFILGKRPRSALAYHYLGNALLGLGRYPEAATQYRTALAYNPESIPALGNLGVTLIHLGRHGEALPIFEQIIDISQNPAELWTCYENMGKIYEKLEQIPLSEQYRQKAKELEAAAAESLALYKRRPNHGDKAATLAEAIMNAEIDLEDEGT